ERFAESLGRSKPLGRIFLHRALDDLYEARGQPRSDVDERTRGALEDVGDDFGQRLAGEGARARRTLVRDDAKGEDVGPPVDVAGAHLLGRHVERRPQYATSARHALGRVAAVELRDAKVEDLHERAAFPLREEEVLGFEIAVDDSCVVRRLNAVARL